MPEFSYSATDRVGKTIEGRINATDLHEVAQLLRGAGLSATRVDLLAPAGVSAAVASPPIPESMETPGFGVSLASAPIDLTQPMAPAPMDLTQPVAPAPIDLTQPVSTVPVNGQRLEPWERGGPAPIMTPPPINQPAVAAAVPGASIAGPRTEYPRNRQQALRVMLPRQEVSTFERFKQMFIYPVTSGVKLQDTVPFYRQFATLVNAGLSLYQSLSGLEGNTQNPRLKEVAREGQRRVQEGGQFSDVLAAYPWIFPPMHVALIRAAEQGGMLDEALRRIAGYVEHELEIKRMISRETLYPKIVIFVAIMILGRTGFGGGQMAVVGLVLSKITGMQYLMDTFGFMAALLIPVLAAVVVFRLFLFNVKGVREGYDRFKMSIPGLGKLVRMFAIAKFVRTFAALYRAGFSMVSALEGAGESCGNGVVTAAAYRAARHAERGGIASEALTASGFFPHMAIDMFRTGEATGNLDAMLDKVADYYESEGATKSHQLAMIFGVVVFLIVAILVGFQIISFYTGSAQSTMSAGSGG
jgi:type II secretory pathway component PulF